MSLILDALNRSRQDEDSVPTLTTQHPVEKVSGGERQSLPWIVMGIALLLALGVIAWLLSERFIATPVPDADVSAPTAEVSRNIDELKDSATPEPKARVVATEEELRSVAKDRVAEPQPVKVPEPEPEVAPVTAEKKLSVAEDSAVAQLYQNPDAANEAAIQKAKAPEPARRSVDAVSADNTVIVVDEQPIDIEKVLQQAREEVKNEHLDEHAVPFLSNMSQQTKDTIPTVYYQGHDYSSNPSISTVTLNGKPLKVGGSTGTGMKVEEILPDSVVLNYQGTSFRLRALNSWINL